MDAGLGEFAQVAVRTENVNVTGMERGDGDGTAPVDEVLGEFADLGWRQGVAGLLADLVEAGLLLI
mgnify:CR=1 FL=1